MTSTFSANLNLNYMATGDQSNAWGSVLNSQVFANIDLAAGGTYNANVAGSSDVTPTATNALNLSHILTGILTGNINYILPAASGRMILVNNSTTGSFTVTVKTSGGTGVVVPQGTTTWVYINNATNVASIPFPVMTEQSIASATTTDIGSTGSNMVKITGTTTITALGSSANQINPIYFVRFSGALTLTYNASSLILPSAASITTAANDAGLFEYLGSGNWQCLIYQKANGQALVASGGNPFIDSTAIIKGSSDATKLFRIEVDGFTSGQTRVMTPPDADFSPAITTRAISVAGLATGGGDLSADRTITVTAAVQADMETASSTTIAVTPGVVKYHPGVPKAWLMYNGVTNSILASYNVTSVTDNGNGDYTVNFTTAFSSANYGISGICNAPTATAYGIQIDTSNVPTASACRINIVNAGNGALTDVARVSVSFFGDQ